MGQWSIYKEDGSITVGPITNTVLFIPYIVALFWSMKGKVLKNKKLGTVILAAVKHSFLFSALIETVQLLFSLGTFQLSDFFYNTLGGFIGGLIYWICYKVKHRGKTWRLHNEQHISLPLHHFIFSINVSFETQLKYKADKPWITEVISG